MYTASRGCTFFLDQPQTLQTPYSHRNRAQRQKKETGKKSSRLFLVLEIEIPLELTGPEAAAGAWVFILLPQKSWTGSPLPEY